MRNTDALRRANTRCSDYRSLPEPYVDAGCWAVSTEISTLRRTNCHLSPVQVLTAPDAAWLRWSDENRYTRVVWPRQMQLRAQRLENRGPKKRGGTTSSELSLEVNQHTAVKMRIVQKQPHQPRKRLPVLLEFTKTKVFRRYCVQCRNNKREKRWKALGIPLEGCSVSVAIAIERIP